MTDNSNGNAAPTNKPPQPAPLKIASAREFRRLRREGQLVELPSGLVAKLRPVAIMDLLKSGAIPDGLTVMVADLVANGALAPDKSELTAQLVKDVHNLYAIVCRSAFISPVIVDNPHDEADEIEIEDVPQSDRQFVLAWCTSPTAELRTFRDGEALQDPSVGSVEPSNGVRHKA